MKIAFFSLVLAVTATFALASDDHHDDDSVWWKEEWKEDKKHYGKASEVKKECVHGEFRCTDASTDRCDHGVWFANPCAAGTKCLGCGDWGKQF